MLQPVGPLPPSVYWRRRLLLLGVVAVVVLTVSVVFFGGGGSSQSNASSSSRTSRSTSTSRTSAVTTPGSTLPSSTAVSACTASALSIGAATGKPSYAVGSKPDLYLVVTNSSATPCSQDLADKQVVLTVSTGDVRVWGSHDCAIQPGSTVRTLLPKRPVRLEILWSGTTSAPGCQGQRLQVQSGTYSLVASLSGEKSKPVSFAIS